MQFLSSISGLPISAASAGYAPTNGADVSAIASAYADPKLDATASASFYPADNPSGFITGVDLTNYATTGYVDSSVSGKLDTTAFSDVSGNFLTAVPEEYATTAFVDSSVSGKLDSSASGDFYSTSNPSGFITGIDLSDYATTSYVDSSVSSKMDTAEMSSYVPFSAISADENSSITSINGSSIGGAQVVTSITTGGYGVRAINGMDINASHMVFGAAASDNNYAVKLGSSQEAGVFLTGSFGTAYYKVNELKLNRGNTGFIGFNIGGAGSQITATSYAGGKFSAGGTGVSRSYFTAFNASASASIEVTGGSAMVNLSDTGYTSTIYPSSIPYWNGKLDSSAIECDTASAITAIGGSAIAGGGGVDEATVSAIASAYADPKQDASAMTGYIPTSESANYYSTSNPSGFITSVDLSDYATTAYVDSSVSSKLDETAFSTVSGSFLTAVPAGYATESYVDSAVSGKLDSSSQVVTSTGSASAMMMGGTSYYASQINGLDISAQKAYAADVWMHAGDKLDTSSIETSVDGITGIAGTAIAGGGASYTSPSGTIIVGADTLEGTDSGVGITNLTSYQKSGYLGTTYGVSASGSSNYPTIFKLSGSAGTLSCRISSNGAYYTSVFVEELNGPVVIPSGSWRIQKNNYAPMYWTAENYYSGTANVQLAHKSDVAVTSITRTRFYDYSTNPATTGTAVSAINGEPIQARSALSAHISQYARYTDDGRPLSAMVTATPYSKNGTIHVTGLEVEGSDSAFMPSPYVESGAVTAVPSEWQSSESATHWTYQWNTDTSAKISRIDISGLNSAGSVSIRLGNYRGDGGFSTSLVLASYVTSVYELKAPFYVDYVYLDVSSQNSASSISSITFTAYSQESGTVVPLAHASSLPTYGYDGTAITSIDGSAIGGGGGGIDSATCSAIASAYAESSVSAVSGNYYSTSNPSGFITGVDLSPYQLTADMSGYLGTGESANYYSTSNPSGFITGVDLSDYATTAYVDSSVSGKLDTTAFNSGDFYSTSNPSGFLTATYTGDGTQVYATGTETSTNQFSAANASAGASIIAGTKARVRLWDSDYTGNMYASSIQHWNNKLDGSSIQYVAGSSDATANGVLYILTGNA